MKRLMIAADGGGSNGSRLRLWKTALQQLADETSLIIQVCHYPVGEPIIAHGISANYEDILDHCCFNWNKLVERPWLIMSIGTRQWAHG
jgi:hypothetical protein